MAVFLDLMVGTDQFNNGRSSGTTAFVSAIAEFGGVN